MDHAKVDARLKSSQVASMDYEREINDFSERYSLLNELKSKIELEGQYLQQQNTHLMKENELLNKESLHRYITVITGSITVITLSLFSRDKYNQDLRESEKKLADARRQKERVEEKLMQTHARSPSPLKKPKSWPKKMIDKITKTGSGRDRKSHRKSDRAAEVTLKNPTESDGYASQDVSSIRQSSENTLEGSISSNQSSSETKLPVNSILSEPDMTQTILSEGDSIHSEPLTVDQLQLTPRNKTVNSEQTTSPNSECISLQQFLNENNSGGTPPATTADHGQMNGRLTPKSELNQSQQSIRYVGLIR